MKSYLPILQYDATLFGNHNTRKLKEEMITFNLRPHSALPKMGVFLCRFKHRTELINPTILLDFMVSNTCPMISWFGSHKCDIIAGATVYTCEICQLVFSSQQGLKIHGKRIHKGVRAKVCLFFLARPYVNIFKRHLL